ncbi:MAG: glycosyltransferase family 4 protein [Verrucomicrobiales bacterium]|nr:glycosyltransferase family 4 protein [Verrucomicrobiales bacterium]
MARIIQLIDGGGQGGADRVAVALGDGLRTLGYDVVFAVNPEFLKYQSAVQQHHECRAIPRFRGLPWAELKEFKAFASEADLVLTHDSGSRHFGLWAKALGLRPPVWFMRHCISGTTRLGGVQLHRLLVERHVAVSDVIARGLVEGGYPRTSVSRIYGGVDLSPFVNPDPARVASARRELLGDVPAGTLIVGMVARLNLGRDWRPDRPDFKGYDVLFGALSQVKFPWRVLTLGPEGRIAQDAVRQIAGHQGCDPARIIFPGFVKEPSAHYSLMDLNVLPSRKEGLGLAVVEGMAAGVPTLGSRSGGISEIIEDGESGILFEPGNPKALRTVLERVVADRVLRERIAAGGRRRALEAFDAPVMVRAFDALLRRELKPR